MAGLPGDLYPVSDTINDPLMAANEGPENIEVEETAAGYRRSVIITDRDGALSNSTTFSETDSSTRSSSHSDSLSISSATTEGASYNIILDLIISTILACI